MPLEEKASTLGDAVRNCLEDQSYLVDGVVVSSGALIGQGHDEDAEADGVVAMRRLLDPIQVRETIVIPLRPTAHAATLVELYRQESGWLACALAREGLPTVTEVCAWSPG